MSLRTKIAERLTGNWYSTMQTSLIACANAAQKVSDKNDGLEIALRKIIALDTPKAAHGVKKAVRIAREALGE